MLKTAGLLVLGFSMASVGMAASSPSNTGRISFGNMNSYGNVRIEGQVARQLLRVLAKVDGRGTNISCSAGKSSRSAGCQFGLTPDGKASPDLLRGVTKPSKSLTQVSLISRGKTTVVTIEDVATGAQVAADLYKFLRVESQDDNMNTEYKAGAHIGCSEVRSAKGRVMSFKHICAFSVTTSGEMKPAKVEPSSN